MCWLCEGFGERGKRRYDGEEEREEVVELEEVRLWVLGVVAIGDLKVVRGDNSNWKR